MKILVINSGSSSIKYQLFDMRDESVIAAGILEQIGEKQSRLAHRTRGDGPKMEEIIRSLHVDDHRQGFDLIESVLNESGALQDTNELSGIGHRVVHGGEVFRAPTVIDGEVVATIRRLIPLAPLHNPANLLGIEVAMDTAPRVPQVAVFDTAFHHSLPPRAYRYALPRNLYPEHGIRRYGFHGTSHGYVARRAAAYLMRPLDSLDLITLHLGNGASITAVKDGKSIDTSMGMTPLEGLMMGTRCGDLDPAITFFLMRETGLSGPEVESLLNQASGLKGVCGANDMREVLKMVDSGNEDARLAVDMYCYRIRKYIGAYLAALGRLDALVFTGGIGQNAPEIRQIICEGLKRLGIDIARSANTIRSAGICEIQGPASAVKILVIPTNEELDIARQTVDTLKHV
jgi:acetate kinase